MGRFDATETEVTELEYDHRMVNGNESTGLDSDRADKIFEDFGDLNERDMQDPNDSNAAIIPSKDVVAGSEASNTGLITPDSSTNLLTRNSSDSVEEEEKPTRFQLIDMDNVHSDDGDVESDHSSDDEHLGIVV